MRKLIVYLVEEVRFNIYIYYFSYFHFLYKITLLLMKPVG